MDPETEVAWAPQKNNWCFQQMDLGFGTLIWEFGQLDRMWFWDIHLGVWLTGLDVVLGQSMGLSAS